MIGMSSNSSTPLYVLMSSKVGIRRNPREGPGVEPSKGNCNPNHLKGHS